VSGLWPRQYFHDVISLRCEPSSISRPINAAGPRGLPCPAGLWSAADAG
jgi:hypothetical protein